MPATRTEVRGLQVWPLAEALCRVGPRWFAAYPQDAQIALAQVRDVAELLAVLLQGEGLLAAAGRLAGALRFCGRAEEADRLLATMRTAGFEVRESNPFEIETPTLVRSAERSPYALRIAEMWTRWREPVIGAFPPPGPVPTAARALLKVVDERYAADAYNSLSIEGYQVTDALIERVARRGWNPDAEEEDQRDRDVLAARGYYDAFQAVRETGDRDRRCRPRNGPRLARRLDGRSAAITIAGTAHCSARGEGGHPQSAPLAGYRNGPVYIRQSKHVPRRARQCSTQWNAVRPGSRPSRTRRRVRCLRITCSPSFVRISTLTAVSRVPQDERLLVTRLAIPGPWCGSSAARIPRDARSSEHGRAHRALCSVPRRGDACTARAPFPDAHDALTRLTRSPRTRSRPPRRACARRAARPRPACRRAPGRCRALREPRHRRVRAWSARPDA